MRVRRLSPADRLAEPTGFAPSGCRDCRNRNPLKLPITMALQPILLADFQPDIVKLDMALTRGVDTDRVRRAIVSGIVRLCEELDIRVIAEGIETATECLALQDEGISLFQGYLFARPGFESLPVVPPTVWPTVKPRRAVDRRRR